MAQKTIDSVQHLLDAKTMIEEALPDATPEERLQMAGLLLIGPREPDTVLAEPRRGTKADQLIAMLKRPRGATLDEVMNKFDLKKNSAYARISVVTRKANLQVDRSGGRYRVHA